jgi:hypothetical protein
VAKAYFHVLLIYVGADLPCEDGFPRLKAIEKLSFITKAPNTHSPLLSAFCSSIYATPHTTRLQ